MQLAKSITLKKIKTLHCFSLTLLVFISASFIPVFGQDNSPYSRFGIGDLVPNTNISTRSMGGISAGYFDNINLFHNTVNFSNPASYSDFEAYKESRSKKLQSGRVIFDVGVNLDNRTLKQTTPVRKFTASNFLFSNVNIGIPVRQGWGLSFGLRPISRISYKVFRAERLKDPVSGNTIDSATTRFEGDGGSYLVSGGTGFKIFKKQKKRGEENLSFGFNVGYLFGKKDYSTRREFRNDTVQYFSGNYQTQTNFKGIYFDAGLQYRLPIDEAKKFFGAGVFVNMGQKLTATQDRTIETFLYDQTLGDLRLDSVSEVKDIKGKIQMPFSITGGITFQKIPEVRKSGGFLVGIDINYQNWDSYRFYGQKDSVKSKLEVRLGGQVIPIPRSNFFSRIAYRGGFIIGSDYINAQNKNLPQLGITMGFGLPIANYNRLSPNQMSILNLSFEYIKRGNNNNLLRENLFRLSAGFAFSDMWFIKRKYD
ncbi:MAG TPA: hypothetical protein VMZ03_06905 [Chitinophagaceae bacterium]|nr:hypothetical protein [Chitinophagaceae bacterium]